MASTSTLLLALALALSRLPAATIPFSSSTTAQSIAVGNSVTFNGELNLAQFDPSLGSLDSIDFMLRTTGALSETVALNDMNWRDFFIDGSLSFMGATIPVRSDEIVYPCGFAPTACTIQPRISYLDLYFSMAGLLTEDANTFKGWSQGWNMIDTIPGDLRGLLGTGALSLPVISTMSTWSTFNGILDEHQTAGWTLTGHYNYTPVVVPEPGLCVFSLAVFFGIILVASKPKDMKSYTHLGMIVAGLLALFAALLASIARPLIWSLNWISEKQGGKTSLYTH